jgi:hypothetical protein
MARERRVRAIAETVYFRDFSRISRASITYLAKNNGGGLEA